MTFSTVETSMNTMTNTPRCCRGCRHVVVVEDACRLLAKRDLRTWVGDQPCRVSERVQRYLRLRGARKHDVEDLTHDILVRLITSGGDSKNRIPARPVEAFRWCRRVTHNMLTDRARKRMPVGGGSSQIRRECGSCVHRDRQSGACSLTVGTNPHTGAQRTNPHFGELVAYHTSPDRLTPPCPYYEQRFQPSLGMGGPESLGAAAEFDQSDVEVSLDAQLFLEHLAEIDPSLTVVVGFLRAERSHTEIAQALGCSERTVYRRIEKIETELATFFRTDEPG